MSAFLKFPRKLSQAEQYKLNDELAKHKPVFKTSLLMGHFRASCSCGHELGNFRSTPDGRARCSARVMEHLGEVVARFFGPTRVGDA